MPITLNDVDFSPGLFWCLHVEDYGRLDRLILELTRRFDADRIAGLIAAAASPRTVRRRLFRKPTVVDWLCQNSGLSPKEAASVIAGFPIPVAPLLCQNAWNPLTFLGLAAAITKSPAVIVYTTAGMDPSGTASLHEYAQAQLADGCLIHASALAPTPSCPTCERCATVRFPS